MWIDICRRPGQLTSMFGTYIRRGELLIYPFFDGHRDNNKEYKPSELGFGLGIMFSVPTRRDN